VSINTNTIAWDAAKLERFKKAVADAEKGAVASGCFAFEGHDFYLPYAKYLIQHLEGVL